MLQDSMLTRNLLSDMVQQELLVNTDVKTVLVSQSVLKIVIVKVAMLVKTTLVLRKKNVKTLMIMMVTDLLTQAT